MISHSFVHMSCELGSTGPREKVACAGSSPAITVPAAIGSPVSSWSRLTCSHANEHRQEKHTHTLSPSCGLFTWDHDTSTYPECRFSGRKGTRYTESGWRAVLVGIDHNPAQFFWLDRSTPRSRSSTLLYMLTTGMCSATVILVLLDEPSPVPGFPAPTSGSEPSLSPSFNNNRTGLNIQDGLGW